MKVRQWVEKDEFEKDIQNSKQPMIVLFAADWCGYCTRFLSVISGYEPKPGHLAGPYDLVSVVNIDSGDGSLWDKYHVDLVPTLIVFSSGEQVFRRDGKVFVGLKQLDLEQAIDTVAALARGTERL